MNSALVVLASFIIFLIIAYRLGYKKFLSALDGRIQDIKETLDRAEQENDEIIKALNEEHRHQENIKKEAKIILENAERQVLSLRQKTLREISEIVKNRQMSVDKLERRLKKEAAQKLHNEVVEKTVETLKLLITGNFSEEQHQTLNNQAIEQIITLFNCDDSQTSEKRETAQKKRVYKKHLIPAISES
jgi:F0F1-type ATP synthase membrane subunit b/b'